MRSRACACLVFSIVLCPYLGASEVDPRAVLEALREQMKELHFNGLGFGLDVIY